MPDPNGTEIAQMYVGSFGIEAQRADEPNHAFRNRVAQILRTNRQIIDAHEVQNNRFHDEDRDNEDGSEVVKGVMGAAALALSGHGELDSTLIDRAGYELTKKREREMDPAYADMMMMLVSALGGGR
jgi:hypothetical protein